MAGISQGLTSPPVIDEIGLKGEARCHERRSRLSTIGGCRDLQGTGLGKRGLPHPRWDQGEPPSGASTFASSWMDSSWSRTTSKKETAGRCSKDTASSDGM